MIKRVLLKKNQKMFANVRGRRVPYLCMRMHGVTEGGGMVEVSLNGEETPFWIVKGDSRERRLVTARVLLTYEGWHESGSASFLVEHPDFVHLEIQE